MATDYERLRGSSIPAPLGSFRVETLLETRIRLLLVPSPEDAVPSAEFAAVHGLVGHIEKLDL